MEGWMYKKSAGGLQTWKLRWFVLQDGSLLYFKKQGDKLQGTVAIKGVVVDEADNSGKSDRKYIFRLQFSEEKIKSFGVASADEKNRWVKQIREHSTLEPISSQVAPKKGAMYSIESAAAGTSLGKGLLKKVVDKEVWVLVDAFSSFLAAKKDQATAATFHEDVVKTLTKAALLYQANQLTDEHTKELLKLGLRITQITIDYYQMPSIFDPNIVLSIIAEIRAYLESVFAPRLTAKNALRLTRAISLFQDEALLTDLFTKNKWKELGEIVVILRAHLGYLHPSRNA